MRCAALSSVRMIDMAECRAFWIRRLHPAGPACPDCGVSLDGRQAETFKAGGRVRCNSCGRFFTYRTGTVLHGANADDRQLYLVAFLTASECSPRAIALATGLSTETVREWQGRFKGGSA